MQEKMKRLPDSELEVMLALWGAKKPVTRLYIADVLKDNAWTAATLNSFLSRLVDKGFLSCEKQGKGQGKVYTYAAVISEDEYLTCESKSFMEKLYGNSMKKFVTSFCRNEKISDQDIAEMQLCLDELKRRNQSD